jgi:hypothetical protein
VAAGGYDQAGTGGYASHLPIHHRELIDEFRLQDKGVERSGLRYYTFNELKGPVLDQISEQGRKASALKSEDQTAFHKQALKLANATLLYRRLKLSLQPEGLDDFSGQVAEFQKSFAAASQALKDSEAGKTFDKEAVRKMAGPLQQYELMAQYGYPLMVPPVDAAKVRDGWQNVGAPCSILSRRSLEPGCGESRCDGYCLPSAES